MIDTASCNGTLPKPPELTLTGLIHTFFQRDVQEDVLDDFFG